MTTNADIVANVMLGLMALGLLTALVSVVWSVVRAVRKRGGADAVVNHVPVRRIAYGTALGTVGLLLLTFVLGSPASMTVNGATFGNAFLLRLADMFIVSSAVLLLVAALAYVAAESISRRKISNPSTVPSEDHAQA